MPRHNPGVITLATTFYREEMGRPVVKIMVTMGGRYAGSLVLARAEADDLFDGRRESPQCAQGLDRVRRAYWAEHERHPIGALVVTWVSVEAWARNAGVGVALYTEAAKIARERYHAAIVADQCIGGQTSTEARRVWQSERFRRDVDVYGDGNVGFWIHGPVAVRNPTKGAAQRPSPTRGRADLPKGLRFVVRWPRASEWDDDYTSDDDLAFDLSILMGRVNLGGLMIEHAPRYGSPRTMNCGCDLASVATSLGIAMPVPWVVAHSAGVEDAWRNTGLGIALYREAARIAMARFGALLVADACTGSGETSAEALRAWSSRRLAADSHLCVRGLVMGWRTRP